MFDNLRDQAAFEFEEEELSDLLPQEKKEVERRRPFLGMTSQQRFILSVLLFFTVCSMGGLILLITGRFWMF